MRLVAWEFRFKPWKHNKGKCLSACFRLFWRECLLISQEKPLNKSLQRGEDPQFDQVRISDMNTSPIRVSSFLRCHTNQGMKVIWDMNLLFSFLSLLTPLPCSSSYRLCSWSAPWVLWPSTACRPSWGLCSTGTRGRTAWRTSPMSIDPGPTPSQKSERTQTQIKSLFLHWNRFRRLHEKHKLFIPKSGDA